MTVVVSARMLSVSLPLLTLSPGARLGPYEIVALLGRGGMGEVYRARDPRLDRDVAIKILPELFASDPDRTARFEREAKTLASLNHPHIAAIYGVEETDSTRALVMELVEGPTLGDRIALGPLPLDEALPIARQIADALDAAHERGIVHRDLKPANVKVTPDARVKVLDFGLAKMLEAEPTASSMTMSPTLSVRATYAGVILGTAAYMSPEQARGKPVDRRTDIWAFGCVLMEMLTGRQTFESGETVSDAVAQILTREPDWAALPPETPASIQTLLKRCLQKDLQKRLPHISSARLEIDDAIANPAAIDVKPNTSEARRVAPWRRAIPWLIAAASIVASAVTVARWAPRQVPPAANAVRIAGEIGADASLWLRNDTAVVLSPDGSRIAFVVDNNGSGQLYVRRLNQLRATPLPGTDGAHDPFFSPDGQWIAFFARGALKKISVNGGAAISLADVTGDRGGAWSPDGSIVFAPTNTSALLTVRDTGGTPKTLTALADGDTTHRYPQVLSGGKILLYTAQSQAVSTDGANIVAQPLPAGPRKILVRGGYHGRYIPGYLLYMHDATLFAVAFDLDRLELTGDAVPIVDGLSNDSNGGAQFSISENGTLTYVSGPSSDAAPIVWVGRDGKTSPLEAAPRGWADPQFSPDGLKLATYALEGKQTDIWTYDWNRDMRTRITTDPGDHSFPVWTPDGKRISYLAKRPDSSAYSIGWQRVDSVGGVQRLTEDMTTRPFPTSWHPSGKFLAFYQLHQETRDDVMILPIEGDETRGWKPGQPTPFANSKANEMFPVFSPDGHWLAYQSDESGTFEVYVRPFPSPGGKWQVSSGGGALPTWSRTRPELLYEGLDRRIMVATYRSQGDSFQSEKPRVWVDRRFVSRPPGKDFDLHPDGERVAMAPAPDVDAAAKQDRVTFVFNFIDELRKLAPPKAK
jgi:Tol biopolymer transport system component